MLIIITTPYFFENEAELINMLFINGLQRLHIRKPNCAELDLGVLVEGINKKFYDRIVVHEHFHLAMKYNLFGIHLNSRNSYVPNGYKGSVSRSLHSVDELVNYKNKYNYVTFSPIFDSVSKPGYNSAFSPEVLMELKSKGLIDSNVVALGGVTAENINKISKFGFGGAMVLGSLWELRENQDEFLSYFQKLSLLINDKNL